MSKWEMVMIEDICSLITDGTHQTPVYADKGYIFLSSKNVTNGSIDWSNVKYTGEELHAKLYKRLSPQLNDILLAKNGTTGVAAIVDKDIIFDIYVSLALLRPSDKIISTYFVYAINNPYTKRKFDSHLKGIGVPNLHLSSIKKTTIPLPPLDEQEKIAKNLDLASDIVKLHKQSLAELDALIQSVFYDMFGDPVTNEKGWEVDALKNLCEKIGDGLHGTPVYDLNGDFPFINGNNLVDGKIIITPTTKYINNIEYQKCSIAISENAILISINGTLGKLAFYTGEKVALGKSACYCNLKNEFNKIFIYWIMKSKEFQSFLQGNSTKSTIKNVSLTTMRNYSVILPPHPLQQKFARIVTEIEEQKQKVQNALTEAETLYNALMQEYFE